MKLFACFLLLFSPCFAAVSVNLPGSTEMASWVLGNANYPSATYRNFGTAANPWGADAIPTQGNSSAVLQKLSGSGYMSGAGFMYTAGAIGNFRIVDNSPLISLQTLVFQGGISDLFEAGYPVLNLNGGAQSLVADFSLISASSPYPDRAWQWNLSASIDPITSYEILFSGHFAATSLRVDTATVFVQAVPESSSALSGILALGLTLTRRRRA